MIVVGVQLSSPKKTWFPDFIRSKRISFPGPMKWVSRRSTWLTYWDMFPYTENSGGTRHFIVFHGAVEVKSIPLEH